MCSLHLTHPSVHTWSSGQPTVQCPGSSRGLPVGAGIRTHNLGLPRVKSNALSIRPTTALLDAFPVFGSNVQVRMKTTSVC